MLKPISNPRIHIEHRAPEPSRASLWARADWLKGDVIVSSDMTEADLYVLAEEALRVAAVLRRQRQEGR